MFFRCTSLGCLSEDGPVMVRRLEARGPDASITRPSPDNDSTTPCPQLRHALPRHISLYIKARQGMAFFFIIFFAYFLLCLSFFKSGCKGRGIQIETPLNFSEAAINHYFFHQIACTKMLVFFYKIIHADF